MAFDNKYPYTDFHELNLDWVLEKVTGIDDRFKAIEEAIDAINEEIGIQTERIDICLENINNIKEYYPLMIASEFDEERQYDPGEIVRYQDEIYKAKANQTPGPFNNNQWDKTTLGDELGTLIYNYNEITVPTLSRMSDNIAELYTIFDIIGAEYDPSSSYYTGYLTRYEGKLYISNADNVTGPWDSTKWIETDIIRMLNNFQGIGDTIGRIFDMIGSDYDSSLIYYTGDYVIYNGYLYKANQNVPASYNPGAYPAYWDFVHIMDEIQESMTPVQTVITLEAGDSGVNWLTDKVTASSVVEVFASEFGIVPTNISVTPGVGVDVSFDILDHDVDILIRLS